MTRVFMVLLWIGAITLVNVLDPNNGEGHYSALVSAAQGLTVTAFFVVPVIAAFGWRSARLASIAGAVAFVYAGTADLNRPHRSGGVEVAIAGAVLALSIAAILVGRFTNGPLADRHRRTLG